MAAAAPDGEETWYFAIGSMTNPKSLELRGLKPSHSEPATLHDYRLRFAWRPGMSEAFADAQAAPGAKFDGVLHRLCARDMAVLDHIESSYQRVQAKAVTYAGAEVVCTVYSMPPGSKEMEWWSEQGQGQVPVVPGAPPVWHTVTVPPGAELPEAKLTSERYVDLLVGGATHFGVRQAHIDLLRAVPQARRRTPAEFDRMAIPDGAPAWRLADVPANMQGRRYGLLNGKVLEWVADTAVPQYNLWVVATTGDPPHVELAFARLRFDIRYGAPASLAECSAELRAYVEDLLVPWGTQGRLAVVARLTEERAE